MIKRSISRNTRPRGIKAKHVLQIILLLGVCIWLIYQVKHSHDKKKELIDDEKRLSGKTQNDPELLKFGRKDLNPRVDEVDTSEKHDEEEEDETGGEDEERKHEDDEPRENQEHEEIKVEETENEGRGGGDDEIDENDQEKAENEADGDTDFIDGDKEKDEGEGETETDEKEEKEEEEGEILSEENNGDGDGDGGDEHTHEAREEHYKGDDASSAVTHDTRSISSETEELISDSNNLEQKEKPSDNEEGVHESSRIMEEGTDKVTESRNSTDVINFDQTKPEGNSPLDSIPSSHLNEVRTEAGNDSTENHVDSQTQQTYNSDVTTGNDPVPESTYSDSNAGTIVVSLKSSNETESAESGESGSGSSGSRENEESEGNGESGVTEEGTDGSENADQGDPIDSSDSIIGHEMEETRMDLDTLPEIRTEMDNSEETAAE